MEFLRAVFCRENRTNNIAIEYKMEVKLYHEHLGHFSLKIFAIPKIIVGLSVSATIKATKIPQIKYLFAQRLKKIKKKMHKAEQVLPI